jgi:hypothetical protein
MASPPLSWSRMVTTRYQAPTTHGVNGEVTPAAVRAYAPRMRDLDVIDAELRLLLAIRRMAREAEGRTQNTARIDALLDERSATVLLKDTVAPR